MDIHCAPADNVKRVFNNAYPVSADDSMLGIRLEPELARRLEWLARATGRPKSDLAREALRAYLDANVEEARRQSLLASRAPTVDLPSDDTGWTAQN